MSASELPAMELPQALYRFFNADGELLYVGISLNPGHRWGQHRADKPWWIEVATITVEAHRGRAEVLEAEREAIKRERPRYNLTHNYSRGGQRMASMLGRMVAPPERYKDACPQCSEKRLPTELHPDSSGWFAVYDCCSEVWTRGFDAA